MSIWGWVGVGSYAVVGAIFFGYYVDYSSDQSGDTSNWKDLIITVACGPFVWALAFAAAAHLLCTTGFKRAIRVLHQWARVKPKPTQVTATLTVRAPVPIAEALRIREDVPVEEPKPKEEKPSPTKEVSKTRRLKNYLRKDKSLI